MLDSQTVLVSAGTTSLSLGDLLRSLHQQQRLRPLLLEALAEAIILDAGRAAGLSVSDTDLQSAADRFRQRRGLSSAEQTRAWLAREGLSVADFESALQRDLLVARFRLHLTQPHLAGHFAAHRDQYARARLRQLVAASEGEARELLTQVEDEGADFIDLARQHSLAGPAAQATLLHRRALPAAIAQALFAARPGSVVGPFATPQGFCLFLVEELLPAELDEQTAEAIRQELFDAWLHQRLREARIDLSWLGTSR